jgi:hypothetical protein
MFRLRERQAVGGARGLCGDLVAGRTNIATDLDQGVGSEAILTGHLTATDTGTAPAVPSHADIRQARAHG